MSDGRLHKNGDRPTEDGEKQPDVRPSYRRPILLGILLACASNFQIGYSITYMNAPVKRFQHFLNQSGIDRGHEPMTAESYDFTWNVFLNSWLVGFGIGVFLNPFFNDKLGRKTGFLIMAVLSLIGSVLRAAAILTGIYELLLLGQFTAAIAVAVTYQSLILMLQECSPTAVRGLLSCTSETAVAFFSIVGTFVGMEFVLGHNLLLVLGFAVLPSVLGVLVLLPMHETPKFLLCFRHDRPAAIRSIRFYHGRDANCEEVLEAIVKESEQETHSQSSYLELLTTPHLRKGVLLGITALQQTTALWVIFFQSIFFLEQVQIDAHWAGWASTAMVFFYTIGSALGSSFVDRWGRRNLLLPFAGASLCLLLLFFVCAVLHPIVPFANYGCVVCLWLYTLVYGFGCGPICWYLVAELAPQMHRSRVQVVCYFTNMVISGAIMFALMPLFKWVGYSAFLLLYVLPGFVSLAVLYAKLPETRGREIHEIIAELKGTKSGDLLKESS